MRPSLFHHTKRSILMYVHLIFLHPYLRWISNKIFCSQVRKFHLSYHWKRSFEDKKTSNILATYKILDLNTKQNETQIGNPYSTKIQMRFKGGRDPPVEKNCSRTGVAKLFLLKGLFQKIGSIAGLEKLTNFQAFFQL